MSQKKLPLEMKPLIMSECWTFNKLAIIQTLPNFDLWLASHLKIYTRGDGKAFFGEYGTRHPLSYYCDILEIREKRRYNLASDQLIDYIISEIDQGNYLVIDVNLNKLTNINATTFFRHIVMIHGYDILSQEFFVPIYSNFTFKEIRVKFDAFKASYEDAQNYFYQNENEIFRRRNFFLGITILTPRYNYKNDNAGFDFIKKLSFELEGEVYIKMKYPHTFTTTDNPVYYTGLSTMSYLCDTILNVMKHPAEMNDQINLCREACLKIYENQTIILRSLKWFANTFVSNSFELDELITSYSRCCECLHNSVLSFHKYSLSPNNEILIRIRNTITEVYIEEKMILQKLVPLLTNLYISFLKEKI